MGLKVAPLLFRAHLSIAMCCFVVFKAKRAVLVFETTLIFILIF